MAGALARKGTAPEDAWSAPAGQGGFAGAGCESMERRLLAAPAEAGHATRHLLDPRRGWFRRLERAASLALSRSVYPRVPGLPAVYGLQLRARMTLSEAEVRVPGLGDALDGLTALLVTDIHLGPFVGTRTLREALDKLLALEPDLILLGGDLATSHLDEVTAHLPALRSLRAPLGVFAVLGNHDHYTGETERLRALLESSGIFVLQNTAATIERPGARLTLAGIDDLLVGTPDLDAALAAAPAGPGPVVLLSHNPDVFPEASRRGVALVLAGHTHGGQIRVPGLPVLVRMSRYRLDEGRYRLGSSELVVSRGFGASGVPLRVACPPEAVYLTLRAGEDLSPVG